MTGTDDFERGGGRSSSETPVQEVLGEVLDRWEDLVHDAKVTVEQYREEGWNVLSVEPGHATALSTDSADRFGIDVMIPDNVFEELAVFVADAMFNEFEAYRSVESGTVFLLVVMKDIDRMRAVVFPAYYILNQSQGMLQEAERRERMLTHVHGFSEDGCITFKYDDPTPFLPPTDTD